MANLIKPPPLDETGKAILAALQGEEPAEQSGSQMRPPMSDETGKAILEAIKALSPQPAPLVVTFSGTTADGTAACDKTPAQIQAAGRNIQAWYYSGVDYYQLMKEELHHTVSVLYDDGTISTYIDCYFDVHGNPNCTFIES